MTKIKRFISLFLITLIILLSVFQTSFAESKPLDTYVIMYLNQAEINIIEGDSSRKLTLEAAPYAFNGTTLIPIRAVVEAFGAELNWDSVDRQVKIIKGDTNIILTIDSKTALVGGRKVYLAEPARILNGRTLIPLRFVSENLGLTVNWYQAKKKIVIGNTGINSGISSERLEYYNENAPGQKSITAEEETFTSYKYMGSDVEAVKKTKRNDLVNNTASIIESESSTTIDKTGQNSVINETEKLETGEIINTVQGYANAQYDSVTGNINIVSNKTVKAPTGETVKTIRIKAYIYLKDENTFVINSSIYEYLPGGDCISYYEEGGGFINGDMQSTAEQMDKNNTLESRYIDKNIKSTGDFLIYNGIVLSDKGILTSYKIDVSGASKASQPEILSKIKEGLEQVQDTIDLSRYVDENTTISEVLDDFDKVLNDYPEIFYCNGNLSYSYSGLIKPVYIFPKEEIESFKESFLLKTNSIIGEIITPNMTDFRKEIAIHDYLLKNTRYDEVNFSANNAPADDYTAYGAIINGTAVCEGYAKAAKLLCDMVGLECIVIGGTAKNSDSSTWVPHAWNQVRINGDYYQLDVTWDDPVPDDPGVLDYGYFNITDKELSRNHQWDKEKYPVCNSRDYNYFYMNNALIDNYQSFFDFISSAVKNNEKSVYMKISNYDEKVYSVDKAMGSILNNSEYSVASCKYSVDKILGTVRIDFLYK